MIRPVRDLSMWMRETLAPREPIRISGGLRGGHVANGPTVAAIELNGVQANAVRLLVGSVPAAVATPSNAEFQSKPKADDRQAEETAWWAGWAKVLTAATMLPPRMDPEALSRLIVERRVVRLFCDTNAVCSGVAEWLMSVLPARTELLTSAIVDKEVMSWADTTKKLWAAETASGWEARLRFQLARRLTIFPPRETVIDRLSPDQNALMLAQGTDKGGQKSSGADLLFVELARPLIREQPRQACVMFVTGDANLAGAATSALGPEHVLYANADAEAARAAQGKALTRGFWHPGSGLGSVTMPSPGRMLWTLLGAFTFLELRQGDQGWSLELVERVRNGGPSDWADPWVKIAPLAVVPAIAVPDPITSASDPAAPSAASAEGHLSDAASSTEIARSHSSYVSTQTLPAAGSSQSAASGDLRVSSEQGGEVLGAETPPAPSPAEASLATSATPPSPLSSSTDGGHVQWLLAPRPVESRLDVLSPSPRPVPKWFFVFVSDACFGKVVEVPDAEVPAETFRVLQGLEVLDGSGRPGPMAATWRGAWDRNDLDWMHAQLRAAHPGYRRVLELLRDGKEADLSSRQQQFLSLPRALGQVAKVLTRHSPARIGDAPVAFDELDLALDRWLPQPGETLAIAHACENALSELHLTPYRFELALKELWSRHPTYPIESRTSGVAVPTSAESVVQLHPDGSFAHRAVHPGTLTFGGALPVLFLARRQ